MNTAAIALLSALSVAGVGTAAVAVSGGQMINGQPMMDGQWNGGGMHGGMHGWGNGSYIDGHHGGCHCCDGDEWNDAGQDQLGLNP